MGDEKGLLSKNRNSSTSSEEESRADAGNTNSWYWGKSTGLSR